MTSLPVEIRWSQYQGLPKATFGKEKVDRDQIDTHGWTWPDNPSRSEFYRTSPLPAEDPAGRSMPSSCKGRLDSETRSRWVADNRKFAPWHLSLATCGRTTNSSCTCRPQTSRSNYKDFPKDGRPDSQIVFGSSPFEWMAHRRREMVVRLQPVPLRRGHWDQELRPFGEDAMTVRPERMVNIAASQRARSANSSRKMLDVTDPGAHWIATETAKHSHEFDPCLEPGLQQWLRVWTVEALPCRHMRRSREPSS